MGFQFVCSGLKFPWQQFTAVLLDSMPNKLVRRFVRSGNLPFIEKHVNKTLANVATTG